MRSDEAAGKIISLAWDRSAGEDGPTTDTFYGVVRVGETEFKRFKITKNDYTQDSCAPCESTRKRLVNEVAKILRQEYGE